MSGPIVATTRGQYALVDTGDLAATLRFHWIETVGGSSRTMAGFYLATDAIALLAFFQDREDREARRAGA